MKAVATDLKAIYSASTESEAEFNLELFAEKWDALYPTISKSWRAHWTGVIPLFAFPEDIRKIIYTTNAIESVNTHELRNEVLMSLSLRERAKTTQRWSWHS
jgi:putative transposase